MTNKDLGDMYIFDNECLMVKSSSVVLFFMPEYDEIIE